MEQHVTVVISCYKQDQGWFDHVWREKRVVSDHEIAGTALSKMCMMVWQSAHDCHTCDYTRHRANEHNIMCYVAIMPALHMYVENQSDLPTATVARMVQVVKNMQALPDAACRPA